MRIGFMMSHNPERIAFAKRHGFRSAELQVGPDCGFFPGFSQDWKAKAAEVKADFAAADVRISCLAAFYMNHLQPDLREHGVKLVRGAIDLAVELGVGVVAGFAGRLSDRPLEESLVPFAELWKEHAKYAEDRGVKIAFEHCPMGPFHLPACGPHSMNVMCTPEMWRRGFDAVGSDALGLEWDPSHLICQLIDPIVNLREFGARVYHVHAKDAHVNQDLLQRHGIWHPGAIEHCHPGLGDTDWRLAIKELLRAGYSNDLNIEGWHDAVYGGALEDQGLLIGLRYLEACLGAQD